MSQYSEWTVGPLSGATCHLCLCSLLAANSQFSIPIGQKMQLTGWDNANNMRNAIWADTQTSIEWPYCFSLYCGNVIATTCRRLAGKHEYGHTDKDTRVWKTRVWKTGVWENIPIELTTYPILPIFVTSYPLSPLADLASC